MKKTKSNARILWEFMDTSRFTFFCCIISSAIMSLCDMLNPQIIRATIDNALGGQAADYPQFVMDLVEKLGGFSYLGEHLWIMAVGLIAVAFVRMIAQYALTVQNTKGSELLSKAMRDRLFYHIEKLPYEWHMANHTGDIIQRCTTDVQMVRNFIAEQLTQILIISVNVVIGLYFMFTMNVKLTLIAMAPIPVIVIFIVNFGKKMTEGYTKCDEKEGEVTSLVQENLSGVRVVRAFAQEKRERDNFVKQNGEYAQLWFDMGKTMGVFWSSQDCLAGLQILFVLIFGAIMCINDEMSSGEYVAFLTYNIMLGNPLRKIGRVISEMSKATVAISRIAYIMNSEEEHDKEGSIEVPLNRDIVFDHVSFGYNKESEILHDVSFEIKAGSTIGILGGTGSGKSSLMLLLDKMYELPEGQGKITIGGIDIRDIKSSYIRENISMVLQEPFLYSRSLAENLRISDDNLSMDDIKTAAKAACLDETIEGFTKGYDTFVGEKGVTLSGGQKQRAAIARALTKNAPIMVFDDSLSAVDTQTDARIRASLSERFGSATTILISHRITTLAKADKVLVLEDGRVLEFDTPENLKKSGGLYNQIFDIQSGNNSEALASLKNKEGGLA